MNELLPCPFCGGEAYHYAPGPIEHHIACKNYKECGADIKRDTEAEAIAAWNSRAEHTCHILENFELPYSICSACGAIQPDDFTVYYCWACGCKVVSE